MKSLFKNLFDAAYILSPIVIFFFVFALALTGNDSKKSFEEKALSTKGIKKAVTKRNIDPNLDLPVFTIALL